MTNSQKIVDRMLALSLICDSRGILTLPGKPSADTLTVAIPVPHVMSVAAYNERFGAKGEGK